jgi:hypothetical protein
MNSNSLQSKLTSSEGRISKLAKSDLPEPKLVNEIYLATYNRLPNAAELQSSLRFFNTPGSTRQTAAEDLAWALINSAEFVFNH